MSKGLVVFGMSIMVVLFIAAYGGAYVLMYDNGENIPSNSTQEPDVQYEGNLDNYAAVADMHRLMNEERKQEGLDALSQDVDLQEVADYKANKMVNLGYISHTSPNGETVEDRFERFNMNCSRFGENLAQTYYKNRVDVNYGGYETYTTESELARGVVDQFMASESHRKNILNEEWETMALGIDITEDGRVYVSQEFCSS